MGCMAVPRLNVDAGGGGVQLVPMCHALRGGGAHPGDLEFNIWHEYFALTIGIPVLFSCFLLDSCSI